MKIRIFLSVALMIAGIFSMNVNAQLKVESTGKVGIGIGELEEPVSQLAIGGVGNANTRLFLSSEEGTMTANQYGISSAMNMTLYDVIMCSIEGKANGVAKTLIGIRGEAIASSGIVGLPGNMGCQNSSIGVYGIAGGSIRDNYGVLGTLQANGGKGAGIFGSSDGGAGEFQMDGRYAGYFRGKTKVNGDFYAVSLNTYNPYPLQESIIRDGALISNLLSLQTIQYSIHDSIKNETQLHYGINPEVMQKLFPNLVQTESKGYSINYVELIPLLITKIQELSAEVESLKQDKAEQSYRQAPAQNVLSEKSILYQNNPNPFSVDTKIAYQLPSSTKNAALYIYDMNGLQIAEYPIAVYGENAVIVSARTLDAGMYLYSLIADGQIVDTKRMILTK